MSSHKLKDKLHVRSTKKVSKKCDFLLRMVVSSLFVFIVAACGSSEGVSTSGDSESGCPESSQDKPLGETVECSKWTVKTSEGTLVPDDVVARANSVANDIIEGKVWVVVTIEATYLGDGASDVNTLCRTSSDLCGLIGKNNVMYPVNGVLDSNDVGLDAQFGPPLDSSYKLAMPRKGGTLRASLWFHVDANDSDLVLALNMENSSYSDDPNPAVWIDVSSDRES
jgi:hypothetical protein